ncbi:unnamed protein product [Caenorhabditis auriculariae]|uniref:FAD synthase n=1 Tax=Caenorhabditis auriculariae TaxID=2777116 RepID=A0A8S1HTE1_9PELO|nr:unnamed protein product [Caenorhabditis auriculariae]
MHLRGAARLARSYNHNSIMPNRKTAAILVIGDEILKGTTVDTNSNFLCKRLHALGVNVRKIAVVGDEVEEIAKEVSELSRRNDVVISTGGVGPTHDDKTYIGLARAFHDELTLSAEIRESINRFLPTYEAKRDKERKNSNAKFEETDSESTLSVAVEKLSMIPRSAELLWGRHPTKGDVSNFPVVRIRNVVAFPGVPKFCERAFDMLQDQLFPPQERPRFYAETFFTDLDEFEFSKKLTALAAKFEGSSVQIGSYPVVKNMYFKAKLIVECEDTEKLGEVTAEIKEMLKDHIIYYDDCAWIDSPNKLKAFKEREKVSDAEFVSRLEEAEKITEKILEEYSLDQIALSFNGGKDCTVLLHLLRAKVDEKYGPNVPIQGFHIMVEDQFPEATQFIIDSALRYNITVLEFPGPLQTGLQLLKNQRPRVVAVFMGSRASDPKGKYMKSPVEWTDKNWPQLLRVCPILQWSYNDVWQALRGLCVPYCVLYDQGYTSLGGRDNTRKNEKLRVTATDGRDFFLPAYKLADEAFERTNRSSI